ncbi:hypothetical protein [Armatimonas sp.]|uniref:hypothetical protein n=1 Tax=Armatimonas sp. TaxID=1872638 RepID=UPI00286C598C|nr:hypothetical protein [Armatimonas sp.]
MLNISLQSRPDETVRPIALQVNTKVQNLPQLDPEQLTALETSAKATAKTGDLATVLSLIQTRRIAKGQSPQTPRTRAAVVVSAVLVQLELHGPIESWPMGQRPGKVPVTDPETGEKVKDPETQETMMVDGTIEYVQTWETFASNHNFKPEEVTKAMPTVKTILELTK